MTVKRERSPVRIVNFVPMPGRRVSWRSVDISLSPFGQCRHREQTAADQLRLLHQDHPDRRGQQDVEAGERYERVLFRCEQLLVPRGELRKDDRELAVRDQGDAGVEALAWGEAADPPRNLACGDLA